MSTLQNTFNKHLRLLKEHLQLNEGYSETQVVEFFKDLKSKFPVTIEKRQHSPEKKLEYSEFIEMVKSLEDVGESFAQTMKDSNQEKLSRDEIMSFQTDALDKDVDLYSVSEEVINYITSVFLVWLDVKEDYWDQHRNARGDMDTISMLDMHPGMSFTQFLSDFS